MRLASIKLAGFKSFVDPTTLELPNNLTAVVGPNGCGKSNIIDAIRWVMGESAASRLRGDAITDVIFNGSAERKPVGQASVELVFDNSDGQVGGEYASYAEISVKRIVGRDAVSSYYLNGHRCRRRDITDIFLGTGLGPRSYAIIEQGMISQIVESAPEDLRVHLEEAAGISKYKERRKETESRIRGTRENLARLDDVRAEVDKQLEHLRRQARQAERYTELKSELARVDAEHRSLCLRDIQLEIDVQTQAEQQARNRVEQVTSELHRLDAAMERALVEHQDAGEAFNEVQGQHYAVGADLARVEQQLQYGRQALARSQQEQSKLLARQEVLRNQVAQDDATLSQSQNGLTELEPRAQSLASEHDGLAGQLLAAEAALQQAQHGLEQHARNLAETQRRAEVERTRIEFQERQQRQHLERQGQVERERAGLDPAPHQARVEQLDQAMVSVQTEVDELTGAVETTRAEVEQHAGAVATAHSEQAQARQQLQSVRGRQSSLETLQHAALGQDRKELVGWLDRMGLADAPRLGSVLQVDEGWAAAVESVLGPLLEAVVVSDPHTPQRPLTALPKGVLCLLGGQAAEPPTDVTTLAAKVRGPRAVTRWLRGIRVAADEAAARALLEGLEPDESVITADGLWFGPSWLRVDRGAAGHEGVLLRAREIERLGLERHQLEDRERELDSSIGSLREAQRSAEAARAQHQQALYQAHRKLAETAAALKTARSAAEVAAARMITLERESAELEGRIQTDNLAIREGRAQLAEALAELEGLQANTAPLDQSRNAARLAVDQLRAGQRQQREQAHQLELEIQALRTRRDALVAALQRARAELTEVDQGVARVAAEAIEADAPLAGLQAELERHLQRRIAVETELARARGRLDSAQQALRQLEQDRQRNDQLLQQMRELLGAEQLKSQALSLRKDDIAGALAATGHDPAQLIAGLTAEARAQDWAQRVVEIEQRVRRLEPVNLAAISELAQLDERKTYLDRQHADLSEALETLEGAIGRIDRETRTRFKDTFDKVSSGVKELFPRLFGGGHAYLELTGEDLLTTGVTIMARPPGKRVSNIALLSGGEKALTAVALVFAIFRLNPAPFCLLDEVDAPLDEANVGRFSEMVAEMSKSVQFVIVTHNKVTMESVSQLAGVTMREPGVSRLVTVDLAEATRLVG